MQKIWVCGAAGQIGHAIRQAVDPFEYEILETDKNDLDVTDNKEVINFGEVNRPAIIINCSGMTDIYACEENPEQAYLVNAMGARNLSIIASKLSAKIVQISTDDVFDGRSMEPYTEFDSTHPKTVYGKSKLAGENFVKEFTTRHFIIRSTWVYGNGVNFVKKVMDKVDAGKHLSIAADHYGSPTNANDLAAFIVALIHTSEYGTYHATNTGNCSRYEFAKEILALTGRKASIKAVAATDSDFSSVHPTNAVLDNFVLRILPVFQFDDWKTALKRYMEEMGALDE